VTLDVNVHFVDSIDEVVQLKAWMSERRPYVAVDTETEGLEWWHERPRLLQVGDRDTAWAIPWDLWGGAILEVLRDFEGDLVMHNAPFDVHVFEHWSGVQLPRHRIHDTRPMAHILDPRRSTALKTLSEELVDREAARSQRLLHEAMDVNGWTWATVPLDLPVYWLYAGMDVILTSRLYDVLRPQVEAEAPAAYELEMAVAWAFYAMERKGFEVDREYTRATLGRFRDYVDECGAWTEANYGVKPGSNAAVIEVLQRETAYEWWKLTPKKQLSLDRDVLAEVIEQTQHPLAITVRQRRRIQKMASSYLDKFLTYAHEGRVHCSINAAPQERDDSRKTEGYGARTGRISIANPPLQQLPRRDNSNPAADAIRNCLTATNLGTDHRLVLCDFDQVEARVFASLSRDPALLGAFEQGDFFTNLARDIYADPDLVKSDPRRQRTKNTTYARLFGAQGDKVAVVAGISVPEANAFCARFDSLYPGLADLTDEVDRVAHQRWREEGLAYVKSPLTGRRLPCDGERSIYMLVNYLVQGTCAEVLKYKDVELLKAGLGDYLVLNVHDEVILDVPAGEVDDVAATVGAVMHDAEMFTVPITAGLDVVPRWGAKGA